VDPLLKHVRNFFARSVMPRLRRSFAEAEQSLRRRPKALALSILLAMLVPLALYAALSDGALYRAGAALRDQPAAAAAEATFARARNGDVDPYRSTAAVVETPIAGAITYTKFLGLVKADAIGAAVLPRHADGGEVIAFETKAGHYATTTLPNAALAAPVINLLVEHQVEILTNVPAMLSLADLDAAVRLIFPFVIVAGIVLYGIKRGPGGVGTPGEWILPDKNSARFADVQGVDEAKAELVEAVEHLLNPGAAGELGAKPPRGVLLVGQPGTGKTMLARAVAGEAGAAFLRLSGSDFVEMWVGLGARRVRAIFKAARKRAPCVIFIDEIDSLGRTRGASTSGADRESDQTLNALLVELDGFARDDRILVLGATNRVDTLDAALVRPGRFDRHIHVGLPDMNGRLAILQAHAKSFKLADGADLTVMARGTPGFTGADLANVVNEAAFAANRRGGKTIGAVDLEAARDRVLMGSERKHLCWRDEERILTAWHEAGHALVALLTPDSDPVHKVTILPRGGALGMVMRLPEHDRFAVSRAKLEADLAVAVGGRVAEELKFGGDRISTGAEADIQAATDLAHSMVARWGMSPRLGFLRWADAAGAIAEPVRREMKQEIDRAMARARVLIISHRGALDRIAEALLDRETLDRVELERIVAAAPMVAASAAHERAVPHQGASRSLTQRILAAE
jgi:cell division protease FtsH